MKKHPKHGVKKEMKPDELLREHGFKVTSSRVAILSLFSDRCNPMSAEQIFEKLSPDADLVTVYRTLASFEKKGILRRADLHKDSVVYELNSGHHHHHIVCTNCEKVEQFEQCAADSLVRAAISHSANFSKIKGHSLEFFGICRECARK